MDQNVTCTLGTQIPYEDFMDLINDAFGFTTPETQFLGLLPKLYRPEFRPQDHNYVVCENGVPAAAVGAYDHQLTVMGRTLHCRGIGNVAVLSAYRGKGYMKLSMEAALEDMVRDGVALSSLGGRRQRYQYFSYDKCGPCHTFAVTADNLRHTYGTLAAPMTAREIQSADDPALEAIKAISDQGPLSPVRARKDFYDITATWHGHLCGIFDNDRPVGYAIIEKNNFIPELRVKDPMYFMPAVRTIFACLGADSITLRLPVHEVEYIAALTPVAEGAQTGCSMSYSVLDYARVLDAFFALKTSYTALADGELTLLIHGRARDERLKIMVQANVATITPLPDHIPVDWELSHLEAMNLLFAPLSPTRDALPTLWRDWFPLPLWIYRADEV